MLAKSNGLNLKGHSDIVSKTALSFLRKMSPDNYDRFEDSINYSALLHDIGKSTTTFQKFLRGDLNKPNNKFRHNEIGWAFLSKYLSDDFSNREYILNTVYWHHGISNQLGKHTDTEILNSLDNPSILNMLNYLTNCVGVENINEDIESVDSIVAPLFYPSEGLLKKNLHQLLLIRSIVITADRVSSNLMTIDEVTDNIVKDYFRLDGDIKIGVTKFDNTNRFEFQKEVIDLISHTNNTSIVKAPAGFGKTIMGIMWGLKFNEKVMWVVPRNAIAESLRLGILEEFDNLGINPSLQVVLSGEVKYTNDDTLKMYEADIIVTNIDNFLAPTFKNDIMDLSSLILNSTVIFDEYHELVSDAPLMALFVNIMRVRHRLTNSNTMLLSATPIACESLWDTMSKKTTIYPKSDNDSDSDGHYPSIHNKKYLLRTTNEKLPIIANSNTLVVKNTISSAQRSKGDGDYSLLIHSSFTNEKKAQNFEQLIGGYNKKSKVDSSKGNVIGTHILQASLDISFNNLSEDVLSPESTLQRIGRCDRFGNCDKESTITITKELINSSGTRSEATIKNVLYSRNLSDSWFDYIDKHNGQHLTLNQIYKLYNSFNKKYYDEINGYIRSRFDESISRLSNIYPIKFNEKKKNGKVLSAGSNKLRSTNNEVFYIVEHANSIDWVGPFSKQVFNDFDNDFRESGNMLNRMLKTMVKLRDSNDERFEFNDIIDNKKYITIDGVRRLSRKSNTPYIVYDRYYDEELGIIKKTIN